MNAELEEAVRRQFAGLRRRLDAGMPRAGWKICVNDRRMQKKLGLDASFVGFLDGARALRSGEVWAVEEGAILGVEPEFAIRFCEGVAGVDTVATLRSAIEGVAPAIEVVDWRAAKLDLATLASTASFHAGFVTGELRALNEVPRIAPGCPRVVRDNEVLGVADPSLVPEDLLGLVRDVAVFLDHFGERIDAGDWLICGACTNPARVQAGDLIEADFQSLGRVSVCFR